MLEYYYLSCYIHEDSEKSYYVIKFYAKWFCKAVFGVKTNVTITWINTFSSLWEAYLLSFQNGFKDLGQKLF